MTTGVNSGRAVGTSCVPRVAAKLSTLDRTSYPRGVLAPPRITSKSSDVKSRRYPAFAVSVNLKSAWLAIAASGVGETIVNVVRRYGVVVG